MTDNKRPQLQGTDTFRGVVCDPCPVRYALWPPAEAIVQGTWSGPAAQKALHKDALLRHLVQILRGEPHD